MLQARWRHLLCERQLALESRVAISNQQLREAFLTPQMKCYFERKLPKVPATDVGVRIEETLKFLNIAVFCDGNIPVSQEIDDIWHLWILETREYSRLCASLEGRKFIHHSSNVYAACGGEDAEVHENHLEQDVAALANYVRNYGPFEADRVRYWPLAAHLVENCGMSLGQLNAWLSTGAAVAEVRA
jgi:hypothetical protein